MFKTSLVKPFLIWSKYREAICVKDVVRPTCATPLKQVSFEGEDRSQSTCTGRAGLISAVASPALRLSMNKLLLICLLGTALVALTGGNSFVTIRLS